MLFILFGLFIDGLQALVAWAFLAMGSAFAVGTLGIGSGAVPLGIGVGMGVDICIDATFGVALITALGIFNKFDMKSAVFGGLLELVPGVNFLPGWTGMAVSCVLKARAKEKLANAVVATKRVATEAAVPAQQEVYA